MLHNVHTDIGFGSDILAEVDLPPSGISRFESMMQNAMPTIETLKGITSVPGDATKNAEILRYYCYQIQLRRTLNAVHFHLYKAPSSSRSKFAILPVNLLQILTMKVPNLDMMNVLSENLESWRKQLGAMWDWDDDSHESPDINEARMRGKYYGAKCIIHRPALQYALNLHPLSAKALACLDELTPHHSINSSWTVSPATPPIHPANSAMQQAAFLSRLPENLDPLIIQAAKTCISAAIRSTTVFDKVPERLTVTNIFGTAHA
jgi:hypothetical protein